MCKKLKVASFWNNFGAFNKSLKVGKHTWYFYQVVRKTSLQSVQETQSSHPFVIILALATNHSKSLQTHLVFLPSSGKTSLQSVQETQSSHPFGITLALATNHGKSSQTHLVFLPSSSKDLTAKCARNTKFTSFWNNFGPCNKSRQKLANTPGISTK